jgi:hypothetical protein
MQIVYLDLFKQSRINGELLDFDTKEIFQIGKRKWFVELYLANSVEPKLSRFDSEELAREHFNSLDAVDVTETF